MTHRNTQTIVLVLTLLLASIGQSARADGLMTIGELSDLLNKGASEKIVVVGYVQGVIEGFIAMDSLLEKEQGKSPEFCQVFQKAEEGPLEHPANKAEMIVRKWEETGRSMDTLAVDVLLMYMTAQYGC